MKFKSLMLAAAVTAASFSGAANAAIDGPTGSGLTVNSDLVLFVYDTVKDLSYVHNLDVKYNSILAGNGVFGGSFALDAAALNIFSTSTTSNLVWGLGAASLDYDEVTVTESSAKLGAVLTTNAAYAMDFSQISGVNNKFDELATLANLYSPIGTANATYATGVAASQLSLGVNHFSTQTDIATTAGVNTAQNLWFIHLNAEGLPTAPSLASSYQGGLWTLNLANATLSAPEVPQVPLPAAAWLMISALMGLGGIARRRNAKV